MRNNFLLASLAMAMIGSAGCVGGLSDPGTTNPTGSNTPTSTPRDQFNSQVAPLLSQCASCHVGPETSATNMFLGQAMTPDSYYAGITGDRAINGDFDPMAASLLLKGAHEGPAWSAAAASTISDWLDAEAAARPAPQPVNPTDPTDPNPNPTQPNLTARGAEMQWAACLSISSTEFTSTKAYAIADMNSDNGRCYSCHEPGGAGGAYWGKANNYLTMLSKWQEEVFLTGAFQAQAQSGATVTYQMAVAQQKVCDKGQEQANNEGTHPAFDCNQTVDGVQPLQALASFTTMVQAKIAAGTCPTPAFLDPTAGSAAP